MTVQKLEDGSDILVVDDDPHSRMWARRWLQEAGFTVREAESAEEALSMIATKLPDLILLDVILPDINGFELTRRLREDATCSTIPILMVTVLDDLNSKVQGLEAGANDFLTKLPEQAELLARVRTHLRLKRHQEELLAERNKTSLLYHVSRELTTELDLDTVLSRILESTISSIGASRGSLILLDEYGGVIRHIYSHQGEVTAVTDVVKGRIVQEGLAGWVIRHRQGAILSDTRQDSRWIIVENLHAEMLSALAAPLTYQERVAGVLTLTHEQPGRFTPAHLDLVNSIASQAAVALLNAQLFETVEQERGRLKAILTGTADAIVATDGRQHITLLNKAAERAFGVSFAEVAGQPLEQALPYDTLAQAFRSAQEEAGPAPPTELTLHDGRTLFFTVSSVAAGPKGEGGWVAVMQDITYLKEVNRLKNEFVSTVSHDLRTPLATIHGYAEVLTRMIEGESREIAQSIMANARRTADLVEELLDLGKIEAGVEMAREPCPLEQLVVEAVEEACFLAESREITLKATIPSEASLVLGNPTRLRQVLDNLISNALKYTPAGGSVSVWLREKDDKAIVTVQDSGIGIPREALPRIFEKFYRVPHLAKAKQAAGTGLGLAIVKAIIEQHGGQIWVESEVGQGSTFGFSLPCHDE